MCPTLSVASVYGGVRALLLLLLLLLTCSLAAALARCLLPTQVPIGGQMRDLERGVDVVVGTPGRIMDLIDRQSLHLDQVCAAQGGARALSTLVRPLHMRRACLLARQGGQGQLFTAAAWRSACAHLLILWRGPTGAVCHPG